MPEIEIDKRDLERLIETLDASPAVLREARRKAFEMSTAQLHEALRRGFESVGLKEQEHSAGKLLSWQGEFVGTGGGYAAVRPKANAYTATNGRGRKYAVGHVTNAIESGHSFPTPSGGNKKYKPRIRSAVQEVRPYAFYAAAQVSVPALARETCDQILQTLIDHFEGA